MLVSAQVRTNGNSFGTAISEETSVPNGFTDKTASNSFPHSKTLSTQNRNPLFYEGFEGDVFPPPGWILIDADGDGHDWLHDNDMNVAYSISSLSIFEPLNPNNYLITPPIILEAENMFLEFKVSISGNPAVAWENYSVLVSTTTPTIEAFTTIHTEIIRNPFSSMVWYDKVLNLS